MICGWCMTNQHKECRPKMQKWYHGFTGVGRSRKPAVVMLDEYHICTCTHKKKKIPVTRRRKTK